MKQWMHPYRRWSATVLAIVATSAATAGAGLLVSGCTSEADAVATPQTTAGDRTEARDGGTVVHVAPGSDRTGLLKTVTVTPHTVQAQVTAPARVVAGVSESLGSGSGPILIFDTPDLTSLYSTFTQSRAALEKSRTALARVQDLYQHQAATGKELSEAETDVATTRAAIAEVEAKIRMAGFNPDEFQRARAGTAWVISDVPETLLDQVKRGETSTICFASFPGEKFSGRVEAVGDAVDNTTRTVKVRIALANPEGRLKPGMFAQAAFGQTAGGVLAVPQSSVITVLGRHYVFVRSGVHDYRRRPVELGRQVGDSLIVTDGLQAGDELVTEGTMFLKGISFGY
ncbi:MAG TPA: efflux RND transporter periplasmic adaptor subunit [Candidatus Kapabacteria bacterium]|nr:efflux RND transporter periplasmic adaptor subunit [Candidatus Kapabacteria bacterium]